MAFWKTRAFWQGRAFRKTPVAATALPTVDRQAIQAAYIRGRREERRRHRHPILSLIVGAVALVGAAALAFAVRDGSFAEGGKAMDRNLATAAVQAQVVGRDAGAAAGQAVKSAASDIKARIGGTAPADHAS